ncbi:MAG: hypothetical protein ABI895_33505 [Deltaproteobacteria bacterium]
MSHRPPPQPLRPELALLLAGLVHASLLAALHARAPRLPADPVVAARETLADVELSLIELQPATARKAADDAREVAGVKAGWALEPALRPAVSAAALATLAEAPAAAEPREPAAEPASAPADEPAPGRRIDLGLNDGVRRSALLEGWLEPIPAPAPTSPGGLVEGLAALDAERGLARSSAATHAAYAAARLRAPPLGIGVFDIQTNERGVVLSVTLVSAGSDLESWQRVGQELHGLLRDRPLRVAPGAKGLLARLRIERGELAVAAAERGRTKRGAALGQAPLHAREQGHESTRASLEPGQLSPTLGITVAGGPSGEQIRVVLVSERAL